MKMNRFITASILAIALASPAYGGTFMFAESQEDPDIITHPIGYNGTGETLEVSVCIATDSESQSELEIPVQNAAATWTTLQPTNSNVTRSDSELGPNQFDVESVLLHELGHCIGLAHPNLGKKSEPNLTNTEQEFAMALNGSNGAYDLDAGGDGIPGSRDDVRGDDVNLNWFRIGKNDPFLYESEIDLDTYSNDKNDLPSGHTWIEIASFDVSQDLGQGSGEGVMNQGTFPQETQRKIHNEDATTLRIGMAGLDEDQGTGDDYDIQLTYGGIVDDCDITIRMKDDGFGLCEIGGDPTNSPHISITSGTITLGSTSAVNWYFNSTLSGLIFRDRFEQQ